MIRPLALSLLLALVLPAAAQFKNANPAGEAPGPWQFGTIGIGLSTRAAAPAAEVEAAAKEGRVALKGLAIQLGKDGEAAIAYDLDLCRPIGAWTASKPGEKDAAGKPTLGGKFVTPMNLMSRGEFPTALGNVVFTTPAAPGFSTGGEWKDPRPEPFGPLPDVKFRGMYLDRDKVVLKWDVGGKEVLETPLYRDGKFLRVIQGDVMPVPIPGVVVEKSHSLRAMTKGGPAHWPEPVTTQGEVSAKTDEAYVVDTIKLPDPNPWGVPMFVGGFDFFPDGRAAVCTFHGDVFIVSGLDSKLEKVTWRRFASGLYHALGLRIVNGEIYVTCRDGLWRLKDLNADGEADFYEAFNFDVKVTRSFHEFVFDLQTDPAGNFYFAKAGPVKNGGRGFDEIMAHHGSLLRVSPDGAKLDVVATGFRAPNGLGCGPDGQLTSGDNEGTWTPVCKINWIKPGGFYGVVPLAHREPAPTEYDRPLCWLPKRVDNSGGGQVWVPNDDRWGPWKGQLLHLSYGTCSLFGVLHEDVLADSVPAALSPAPKVVTQGGVARFPLQFQSGVMRARFNPADGQLYVGGLRGWQTTGLKNGAFQRVRYTGAPTRMPIALHAKKGGVELTFTTPVNTQTAADPENYNVEVWDYVWSSAYGSPEISTLTAAERGADLGKDGSPEFSKAQMSKSQHDPLVVKSVSISTDERTIFLEIPGLKPVMQMSLKYALKSQDGAELKGEVVNTIHALGD